MTLIPGTTLGPLQGRASTIRTFALSDVGRHEQLDVLVMEYLDGETLANRLVDSRFAGDETRSIARQMAEALEPHTTLAGRYRTMDAAFYRYQNGNEVPHGLVGRWTKLLYDVLDSKRGFDIAIGSTRRTGRRALS